MLGLGVLIGKWFLRDELHNPELEKRLQMGTYEHRMDYYLYIPPDHQGPFPLVVFLHGYMEGKKGVPPEVSILINEEVQSHGPAFVLAPKCPFPFWWTEKSRISLMRLINNIKANFPIDSNRIYIMGFSLGSTATWQILSEYPDFFAAGIAISGYSARVQFQTLAKTPIWHFYGELDTKYPITTARTLISNLKIQGSPIQFTELVGIGHLALGNALSYPKLFSWLFQQSRVSDRLESRTIIP